MRGDDQQTGHLFSYLSPDARVPAGHPLRSIRQLTDAALLTVSPQFDAMYSAIGRPSIPPEQLLRALLLQVLYSIRSERLLIEQLQYNLLFRWFVGLSMDEDVWVPTVFTKNRDRLLSGDVATAFFTAVLEQARAAQLLSDEHFTVDGTLFQAWAGQKSFRKRDGGPTAPPDDPGNATVDFRGETRSNATHASTTDPDAKQYRKAAGQPAVLGYLGHVLMDNRHGMVVDACVTPATGTAEREAALSMLAALPDRRGTVGADKLFDQGPFVEPARHLGFTPHVAQRVLGTAIDGRTTGRPGYAISQRKRKLVEQIFGWMKTIGGVRQVRVRGGERVDWHFRFVAAAYNLIRMRRLLTAA
ncbi:MAG TPA: IS5 family transposase [Stellaceae bacterium]|nr:IS5 family transposase [Stellaceae bacterium]